MNKNKRFLSLLSPLLLAFSVCGSCATSPERQIHAPIKTPSDLTPTKVETKWSRVSFGHYPSTEVVPTKWASIDDYALHDGDILKDDALYKRLSEASWQEDSLTLDGVTYIREKRPDTPASEQHYRYDEDYHYFVYAPLFWRVLSIENGRMTLLSDKTIDCLPFHEEDALVDWSSCSLRAWLNDEKDGFFARAFSKEEKDKIETVSNSNPVNPSYGTSSGPVTEDKVFILSGDEVYNGDKADAYGFYPGHGYDDPAKRFASTTYAKFHGAWWSPVGPYRGNSFWFMRTSGYTPSHVTYICDFGYIYGRGTAVNCDDAGVLPAITLNVNPSYFSSFDEVSSHDILKPDSGHGKENTCDLDAKKEQRPVITFGEYPQDEVVPATPKQGAEGYIVDADLYNALKVADWSQDVIIDETSYERLGDHYFAVQPIEWTVLGHEENASLLFPTKGLDAHPYHDALENAPWGECSLRQWLNDEFLTEAFGEEASYIEQAEVLNNDNFYFGTSCGEDTRDKVFLLSEEEIFCSEKASRYGFACSDATADPARQIKPTRYAIARGAWSSEEDGHGFFMLRTSGYNQSNAVYVGNLGDIYNRGIPVSNKDAMVMPALRLQDGYAH
ncbi:MAG: hypothetical protein IJS52_08490 [Bacilli bacterium]|nr:hypothetical protein [Bacilli bacterium]